MDWQASPGTPYIFISYSHEPEDAGYVAKLAEFLDGLGLTAWHDRDIPTGTRWEQVLVDRIDGCAAFIVVMSPAAAKSAWVEREVERARQAGRPIFPLLLSGSVFESLSHLQYEPVADGGLPSQRFVGGLREVVAEHRRSGPPARTVGRGFPLRNRYFVGRGDQLRDLASGLRWGHAVAVHGVHGTGGVGKTQLAAEYAYRHSYEYDLIGWIDAEQADLIPTGLQARTAIIPASKFTGYSPRRYELPPAAAIRPSPRGCVRRYRYWRRPPPRIH